MSPGSAEEYILMGHKISELCLTPPAGSQAKLFRQTRGWRQRRRQGSEAHLLLLAGVLLVVGQLVLVPGVGVVRVGGDQGGHQEGQEAGHGDHCYKLCCFVCSYVILTMICFQLNLYT